MNENNQRDLGRLEGLVGQLVTRHEALEGKLDRYLEKTNELEQKVWWAKGVGWLAGLLAGSSWLWNSK